MKTKMYKYDEENDLFVFENMWFKAKLLKVLLEKQVDISLVVKAPQLNDYNRIVKHKLTQAEFDELKEWVGQ